MKLLKKVLLATSLAALSFGATFSTASAASSLANDDIRLLGIKQAEGIQNLLDLSKDQLKALGQAYIDYADGKAHYSLSEAEESELFSRVSAASAEVAKQQVEVNKTKGKEFINKLVKEEGYTLENGVAFKISTVGKGAQVTDSDKVEITYEGKTIDGKVFDAGTHSFPVNQVVKGFQLCLTKLKEGGAMDCVIPQEMGYGDRQIGSIPPGSTLVFKIKVNKVLLADDKAPKK